MHLRFCGLSIQGSDERDQGQERQMWRTDCDGSMSVRWADLNNEQLTGGTERGGDREGLAGAATILTRRSLWRAGKEENKSSCAGRILLAEWVCRDASVELSNQDAGEPKPDSSECSGFSPGIADTDRTEMAADTAWAESHERELRRWARQGSGGGEKKRGVKTAIFDHDDSRNKVTEGRLSRRLRQLT
ncbi:hypothetical protein BDV93DRAFT_503142 [Ceratobasidium sp. AG-I]|nr:hypothetical protein BDV93DRAFT_503142 [Ceratobasidium sp. AG-I]